MNNLNPGNRLEHFPVTFYSSVMGLTGFTLVLQKAEKLLAWDPMASTGMLYTTALIFLLITILYTAKLAFYFPSVKQEFSHPVRISFFPTFTISMLLLSTASLAIAPAVSRILWMAGAALHLIATLTILSMWIRQTKFEISHYNPAWFIPIVGNILVPVAGVEHGFMEISWFFFSVGFVFWLSLFTIFLYRIVFHNPLPEKLLPTLFILLAPPALGMISLFKLTGSLLWPGKILYYFAIFLLMMLIVQLPMFLRIRFFLSWWAYSFPLAAVTIATTVMFQETGEAIYRTLFFVLAAMLSALILVLLAQTIKAIAQGTICVKEE